MALQRIGDLDLNQDLAFQRREWRAERLGWAVLVAVVVLAGLGLFGNGPLSWATASTTSGSLEVQYERFGRRGGSQQLVVRAAASEAEAGRWEIDVAAGYASALTVDSITPQPESVETVNEAVRYTFVQAEPGADLRATFSITPSSLWRQHGQLGLGGADRVRVTQFFFP